MKKFSRETVRQGSTTSSSQVRSMDMPRLAQARGGQHGSMDSQPISLDEVTTKP